MKIQYKFKQSFLLLAVLLLFVTSKVFSATLSLTPAPGVHVSHSTVQLGVYYDADYSTDHAIQFEIIFPPELIPGTPSQGYALLGDPSKAFNLYSSQISDNRLKVVIIPELMTSSFTALNSGNLINLPFIVRPLPDGTLKNAWITFKPGASISSNVNGQGGWVTMVSGSTTVSVSSYLTCNDLAGLQYYSADAKYLDGDTVSVLGLPLQATAKRDINKDGICDQAAIDGGLDSDGDGISDEKEEMYTFLNPYDPNDAGFDYDGDGLSNGYEIALGGFPETNDLLDSDGDVMPDLFEITFGLNPSNSSDKLTDADNDGLSNYLEYMTGSIPTVKDSDADGMYDGFEYANGFPFVAVNTDGASNGSVCATAESSAYNGTGPLNDKDCDGLTNQQEHDLKSNPLLIDTDKDNMPDLAEYNIGRSVTVNEPALMVIIQGLLL